MTTDREVIARSRDRPRAFGELFHRHASSVHRYLARRSGVEVADEVLSETFLVAFQRRDQFDASFSSARPWLLGIATTLLKAHHRREAHHLDTLARGAEPDDSDGGLDRVAARADAATDLRRLAARVNALPQGDRDVLLLHAWAELSNEEIATALGIPVGTVWSRLSRARRSLRTAPHTTSTTTKENDHGQPGSAATA